MEKIKFITDSACDLPAKMEEKLGITVLPIPITVDGKGFLERKDFTNQAFYHILLEAKSIPTTSHVTAVEYSQQFAAAQKEGYTHIVVVTINAKGSNMFEAANLGKNLFEEECPAEARPVIEIIDSKTYTITYGYPVWQAAEMAQAGTPCSEIAAFLRDYFDRAVIYFAPYTLEFAKKSGRINCAAAFVGEVLGLRPILRVQDGEMKIMDKVRGDKSVVPAIARYALEDRAEGTPYMLVHGLTEHVGDQLCELMTTQTGQPPVGLFEVGASIAINAGPRVVGAVVLRPQASRA